MAASPAATSMASSPSDEFRHAFLAAIRDRQASGLAYEAEIEAALDGLAEHLSRHLDLDRILEIAHGR